MRAEPFLWLLERSYTGHFAIKRWTQINGSFNLKARRTEESLLRVFMFLAADVILGAVSLQFIKQTCVKYCPYSSDANDVVTFGDGLLEATDFVVFYLRQLMKWLMGAPAGLKLNSVLSKSLGKFFLYHIHLWRTFLEVTAPYVSHGFCFGIRSGFLSIVGISFQVCLAQDVLNVVTFHVHCFYSYARRIFVSQTSGLCSLWRLFRGLKYNPLRKRVDSMSHTVEQLFVGTVGFTVLLFLYPTTLVYFVIFAILEHCMNAVNFALKSIVVGLSIVGEKSFYFNEKTNHLCCWKE